jgi:alpha-galactosidase
MNKNHLVIHRAHGMFDFDALFQHATAEILFRDEAGNAQRVALAGENVETETEDGRVTMRRRVAQIEIVWHALLDAIPRVWLEITNRSAAPIRLDELRVLALDATRGAQVHLAAPASEWRFYQNGWQTASAAFVRRAGNGVHTELSTELYRVKHQPHPLPHSPKTLGSEMFSVIATPAQSLLLGFITASDQLSEIRLQLNGGVFHCLAAICYADGQRVEPGQTIASEQLLIASARDPLALLDQYASRVGAAMRARVPRASPTGWCSWYYYFGENNERDVIANLERIRAERLPLDVIVIDDGYQTSDGDWTSAHAEKFPHGMKWLADEIKRAGFTPGIWVAPFAANEHSRVLREHPEFLLRDENGAPVFSWEHWNDKCYSLDLTRADVQEWLRETFRVLSDEWGFEFFKLDFLYTGAALGKWNDASATRARALRRGLEIIRAVVGEKTILGCLAPLGQCVGLVDAMRIGPDASINWDPFFAGDPTAPATAHAIRNTVARAFLHRQWWINDPDCVLVRRRDDESNLVLNEMRAMVSAIGLSGGAVLSGDNLPSLRRGRQKYLKQILPPTHQPARALDLFENERAQIFALPVKTDWGEWLVAGMMNWDEKTRVTEIALEQLGLDPRRAYHVYNFWHRRYVGIVREKLELARHQPHETRVLLFKPVADRVELLTTTFHLAQGLCEVKRVEREIAKGNKGTAGNEIVRVELEKPGVQRGQILFAIPRARKLIATRVDGRKSPYQRAGAGIVAVGLKLDERAVVEIEVN